MACGDGVVLAFSRGGWAFEVTPSGRQYAGVTLLKAAGCSSRSEVTSMPERRPKKGRSSNDTMEFRYRLYCERSGT